MPKKNQTSFKPGQSGNPHGRPPIPQEVKVIRQLSREDLVDIGMMVFKGDIPALKHVLLNMENPDPEKRPTAAQALTASAILTAIKKGDVNVLNSLLDRFFGKTPIAILVAKSKGTVDLTPEQRQAEARRMLAEIASDG